MTPIPTFAMAIVAMCSQYEGTRYHEACLKAADAGSRQVGLRQNVDSTQDRANEMVTRKAENSLGHGVVEAATVGGFAYKCVSSKSVSFRVPTLGLADSIENRLGIGSYNVLFRWNLK